MGNVFGFHIRERNADSTGLQRFSLWRVRRCCESRVKPSTKVLLQPDLIVPLQRRLHRPLGLVYPALRICCNCCLNSADGSSIENNLAWPERAISLIAAEISSVGLRIAALNSSENLPLPSNTYCPHGYSCWAQAPVHRCHCQAIVTERTGNGDRRHDNRTGERGCQSTPFGNSSGNENYDQLLKARTLALR